MIPSLEKLKNTPEKYQELLPKIFKELDPDKKLQTHLLWLMATPKDVAFFHIFDLTRRVFSSLEEPRTLGELAKTSSSGTLFECTETGITYQLVGYGDSGIACRELNSELIMMIEPETSIRRIF